MKISLAGVPGSGKSTLRQSLSDKYQLKVKSTGDFMRITARKYGFNDITQFLVEYVSKHPEVDYEIDEEQRLFGVENDDFVLDAHLGFHFVPDSIRIQLDCTPQIAAERIFSANRSSEQIHTLQDAIENTKKRRETMHHNFLKLYDVDIRECSNFDLIVDTTQLSSDEVFQKVVEYIENNPK